MLNLRYVMGWPKVLTGFGAGDSLVNKLSMPNTPNDAKLLLRDDILNTFLGIDILPFTAVSIRNT